MSKLLASYTGTEDAKHLIFIQSLVQCALANNVGSNNINVVLDHSNQHRRHGQFLDDVPDSP